MSEWISVKDKLPPLHEKVLVFYLDHVSTGNLNIEYDGTTYWEDDSELCVLPVTNWMPLPNPPQEN